MWLRGALIGWVCRSNPRSSMLCRCVSIEMGVRMWVCTVVRLTMVMSSR